MSKKIMFSDRFGLTKAVLEGYKTQTRRVITFCGSVYNKALKYHTLDVEGDIPFTEALLKFSPYKIGEVVSIAQSYNDVIQEAFDKGHKDLHFSAKDIRSAGCNNKMFVKAELMPHHIKIVNIRVERLMNISDEDCIKEGILERLKHPYPKNGEWDKLSSDKVYGFTDGSNFSFGNPREAYAALIDKATGKYTWGSNPYVFVYDFELVD